MQNRTLQRVAIFSISWVAVTSFSLANTECASLVGCAKKSCEVKQQIQIAQTQENNNKVIGLQEALSEIETNCKDEDIITKIEKDLEQARDDLKEHQEELSEAKSEAKEDKVEKYKNKIAEDQAEIAKLEKELVAESK